MNNVEIAGLCDVDESHIGAKMKGLESRGVKKPTVYTDFRQMLESKEIDAITTATPNHWHTLVTSGPARPARMSTSRSPSPTTSGKAQQMAADKYNRIVQAGTQSRSTSAREAVKWLQAGNSEILFGPRPLLQWRESIGARPTTSLRQASITISGPVPREGTAHEVASTTIGTGSGRPATATSATRASTRWTSAAGALA